jgi:hypothetical protein
MMAAALFVLTIFVWGKRQILCKVSRLVSFRASLHLHSAAQALSRAAKPLLQPERYVPLPKNFQKNQKYIDNT